MAAGWQALWQYCAEKGRAKVLHGSTPLCKLPILYWLLAVVVTGTPT